MKEPPPTSSSKSFTSNKIVSRKSAAKDGGSPMQTMTKGALPNPVVASLKSSASSYHAIALSPCRDYAVLACKDTLQMIRISPEGLHLIKTIVAAPFFQQPTSNKATTGGVLDPGSLLNLRDFALGSRSTTVPPTSTLQNDTAVVITDVAWSTGRTPAATSEATKEGTMPHPPTEWHGKWEDVELGDRRRRLRTSMIAAAGSNGIIVLWNAAPLLDATGSTLTPTAILNQHNRQVNRLAWHPGNDLLLLSASQDWTVVLWEKRVQKMDAASKSHLPHRHSDVTPPAGRKSFFGALVPSTNSHYPHKAGMATKSATPISYQWHSRSTFAPKSEAVRDIQWSPFYEDGA
jgi:hypothetical protein